MKSQLLERGLSDTVFVPGHRLNTTSVLSGCGANEYIPGIVDVFVTCILTKLGHAALLPIQCGL